MNYRQNNIITSWLVWHFYEMPRFLVLIWKDYLWFGSYFFSVPLLLATLFSPWRRYQWRYPKGFDVGEFFSSLVSNLFSRLIGACMRLVLVVFGIIAQVIIFLIGLSIIIFWILLPFILILLFLFILIS